MYNDSTTKHSITFIVSKSACFQVCVKLVVRYELRSHPHPVLMRWQFPVSDWWLSSRCIHTRRILILEENKTHALRSKTTQTVTLPHTDPKPAPINKFATKIFSSNNLPYLNHIPKIYALAFVSLMHICQTVICLQCTHSIYSTMQSFNTCDTHKPISPDSMLRDEETADRVPMSQCLRLLLPHLPPDRLVPTILRLQTVLIASHYFILNTSPQTLTYI